MAVINTVVTECTALFEKSLEVVTNLQEDPTLKRLETEDWELQQQYDEVKATAHTVALT